MTYRKKTSSAKTIPKTADEDRLPRILRLKLSKNSLIFSLRPLNGKPEKNGRGYRRNNQKNRKQQA
jgi:hypothetical protein